MKRILPSIKIMLVVFLSSFTLQQANAQALLTENFEYAGGTLLTTAGWTAHSGSGTQAVDVIVPGLSFTGYPLSNISGAARLDNTGEDVNKTFTVQNSGTVYMACMVKINSLADGYFMHLGGDPIGTTFRAKVFTAGTSDPFSFGVSVGSNTATTVSGGSFNLGKTYLMVIKYEIADGTTNDKVSLFVISGDVPATEPVTPSVGPLTDSSQSDINPGSIALRQYSASQNILVDGIRIGKTWAEAVTATTASDVTAPVFNSGYPKAANINATQADLQVNLDEAGKAFYLVVKDGDTAPTAAQVFAGVNYGTVTLVKAGNIDVAGGGTVASATITGLTDKTNYDIYVVAQDDETTPNKQITPVLVNLYTIRPPDVISSADFDTSLSPFTQVSLTGDAVWDMYTITTENKCAKMSGNVSSVNYENLDYLISPEINLEASELNKLSFITAKNYTGPALKVMISTNFSGAYTAAAVTAATWTDITANFTYSTGSFTFVTSGEFSLSAYSGKAYIAFVFESSTTQSATWEVDNFLVTGYKKNTGIDNFQTGKITLYPIPAKTEIYVRNIKDVTAIEVFDIHGKMQMRETCDGAVTTRMNISRLSNGIYIMRFIRPDVPVVMKFIKE